MRTTVRLDEALLERPLVTLPECRVGGGTPPGVDLSDSAALLDRMEERD